MNLTNYQYSLAQSLGLQITIDGLCFFIEDLSDSLRGNQQQALRRIGRGLQSWPDPKMVELAGSHLAHLSKVCSGESLDWPKFLLLLEDVGQAVPAGELLDLWEGLENLLTKGVWVARGKIDPVLSVVAPSVDPADPDALILPSGWKTVQCPYGLIFAREDGLAQVEPRDANGFSFDVFTRTRGLPPIMEQLGENPKTIEAAFELADRAIRRQQALESL